MLLSTFCHSYCAWQHFKLPSEQKQMLHEKVLINHVRMEHNIKRSQVSSRGREEAAGVSVAAGEQSSMSREVTLRTLLTLWRRSMLTG